MLGESGLFHFPAKEAFLLEPKVQILHTPLVIYMREDNILLSTLVTATIPAAALIIVQLIISSKQQRVQDLKTEMMIKEVKMDIERL